jgi:type IV pilus assembly protein PilB
MSVLSAVTQKQVQEKLVSEGLITKEKLEEIEQKAKDQGVPLLATLVHEGFITNESLTKTIAVITKVPYVNLLNTKINPAVLELLPQDVAERYMAVPLGEMQRRLVVAMLDADNVQAVDFLSNKIGRPLKVYAASEEGIRAILAQYATQVDKQAADAFADQQDIEDLVVDTNKKDTATEAVSQDSPVSKILSAILEYAVKNRASDIHIEPLEKELKIRCRIDGVMREIMKLPKASEPPIVSRIKILSNLKIDEHRVPQDGQFTINVMKKSVDLRIAISPVVWGEQVVIRLLDKSGTALKLEDMGYAGRALRTIRNGLDKPNGMILTSGPTGSGKSTTLYALLNEIKNESINIVTLEDPVEYKMDGVNQIQVNADVGLTFSAGLRSILRQDPDVVMVGEIRDKETATLAVQAALTGHLVFSTLHTNSAAGILPRLLDMGIEPFLIASTVRTVIGQRLVRRNSSEIETVQASPAETAAIHATVGNLLPKTAADVAKVAEDLGFENLPLSGAESYPLIKGIDSPASPGGYKGRMGLYEVFEVNEEIQKLILDRASSADIQKAAQGQGMVTMRQDGYLKALSGRTTLAEVDRVAATDSA